MDLELEDFKNLIDSLLDYELSKFASQLDFSVAPVPMSDQKATALLNLAERCSRQSTDSARRLCLLICGILYEHLDERWTAAPAFMLPLLSRIGQGPSMPMVDKGFDTRSRRYLPLCSFAEEVAVTARSLTREVALTDSRRILLSDFQYRVWHAVDQFDRLGVSAPTSAGKSFVLTNKVIEVVLKSMRDAVLIVPTLALVRQVSIDLRRELSARQVSTVSVLTSYNESSSNREDKARIFVLTQERVHSAMLSGDAFSDCSVVVVDEIQNLERVGKDGEERSQMLLEVIEELELNRKPSKFIVCGPRLDNIGELARRLLGNAAESVSANLPPVINLTYSLSRKGDSLSLRQYSELGSRSTPVIRGAKLASPTLGRKRYTKDVHDFISNIITRVHGHGVLLFSPTSTQATNSAIELALRNVYPKSERVGSLIEYIAATIHPRYALVSTLGSGVGFHHGKMPIHARTAVEIAFAERDINAMVCTTTLMQGVNLPAKTIVVRNPNLFIQDHPESVSLTPYEFSNLRGRAGRLNYDFLGRSLILDETMFSESDQYFGNPGKEVRVGFEEKFEQNRAYVANAIVRGESPELGHPGRYLVTFIRRAIYVHGEQARERLSRLGIRLSNIEFLEALRTLSSLGVDKSHCKLCPQWDPLDLESIRLKAVQRQIPMIPYTPFDGNFVSSMVSILDELRKSFPYYVDMQLGKTLSRKQFSSLVISAQEWCKELPLRDIIDKGSNALEPKEIDRRISVITRNVMYGLPRLLRPLLLVQRSDNPILGYFEFGGYRRLTRLLLERGVPREVAVRIALQTGDIEVLNSDSALTVAIQVAGNLSAWDRRLLQDVVE